MREAALFPPFENVPSLSIELKAMIKARTGDGLWLKPPHKVLPTPHTVCDLLLVRNPVSG